MAALNILCHDAMERIAGVQSLSGDLDFKADNLITTRKSGTGPHLSNDVLKPPRKETDP
jgi:hypothetical protein